MYHSDSKVVFTFSVLLFTGCTFNRMYYAPTPIPPQAKKVRMVDQITKDTTFIVLAENHQPSFTNAKGELKEPDYTLQSHSFKSGSGSTIHAWLISPKAEPINRSVKTIKAYFNTQYQSLSCDG